MKRFLSDDELAQLQNWIFNQTDGKVVSDPEYRVVERIIRAHRFQAWERAHATICSEVPCRKHQNPYAFVRAAPGDYNEFNESTGDRSEFQGRSLYWLRRFLGLPAMFPTASAAAEGSGPLNATEPPPGVVAWYAMTPYGNCAYTLGGSTVLALDHAGMPKVCALRAPELGEYIGWSQTIGRPEDHDNEGTGKT